MEEVTHRNVRFQVWDLGGQDKLRKVWATYYCGAHAVVLVVDSTDRERMNLVREELAAITSHEVPRALRWSCEREERRGTSTPRCGAHRICAVRRCW